MNKTYLIQAHKNPKQLTRLINNLDGENVRFYIHIDIKSDIKPFCDEIKLPNVHFIEERVDCIWGDYSQVLATLNLIRNAINENDNLGYTFFLSGQDYPIKSKEQIENFLFNNKLYDFIEDDFEITPSSHWYKERIEDFRLNLSNKRGDSIILPPFFNALIKLNFRYIYHYLRLLFTQKLDLQTFKTFLSSRRKSPFLKHYKGAQWWVFKNQTLTKVFDYYNNNQKKLDAYYKYTHCADELFFQDIINFLKKTDNTIKTKPILTYIDWDRPNVTLPVTFDIKDLEMLKKLPENMLFARKFDTEIDTEILNRLDQIVH